MKPLQSLFLLVFQSPRNLWLVASHVTLARNHPLVLRFSLRSHPWIFKQKRVYQLSNNNYNNLHRSTSHWYCQKYNQDSSPRRWMMSVLKLLLHVLCSWPTAIYFHSMTISILLIFFWSDCIESSGFAIWFLQKQDNFFLFSSVHFFFISGGQTSLLWEYSCQEILGKFLVTEIALSK